MSESKLQIRNSTVDFLVFTKDSHEESIEVRVQDNNVWLDLLWAARHKMDLLLPSYLLSNLLFTKNRASSITRFALRTRSFPKQLNIF